MKNRIVIATRESLLALWQARYVAGKIKEAHPEIDVELLPVTTKGDQILDRPLVEIGGKGLFIKELEVMLLEGQADLAVHSLKDMTAELADGLTLAAVTAVKIQEMHLYQGNMHHWMNFRSMLLSVHQA